MNCSQILPGAVNPNPCSLATGYCSGNPFVVYASGKDVILLDSRLQHVQTIFGSNCGYGETKVSCIHCAETTGRLAVAWGSEVVIFEASPVEELNGKDESLEKKFLFEWNVVQTQSLDHTVFSVCWSRDGLRLLTGGACLILWEDHTQPLDVGDAEQAVDDGMEDWRRMCILEIIWRCDMANPLSHVKFSPYCNLFATCGQDDCLVKIWYPVHVEGTGIGTPPNHSFCYVAHPQSVRGFVWRRITPSLPRGCIPNVLLTHCTDNICRIWSHALSFNKKGHLRFFIAASIDPVADIPFRTTVPLDDQPFIVHWLNNKETTLSSKVEKYQKGVTLPISHFSSLQSFTSNLNEEMLQSWVCIDDDDEQDDFFPSKYLFGVGMGGGGGMGGPLSKNDQELGSLAGFPRKLSSLGANLSNLHGHAPSVIGGGMERTGSTSFRPAGSPGQSRVSMQHRRALAHLLDEWCSTPDLLLCIHPSVGSLMVWIVEGIDAPPNLERLVHISFSSCLPHVFPPHLSMSLQPDLLQFLTKEPDVLSAREANSEEGVSKRFSASVGTDISLPVPQIRLSSGGSMSAMTHMEVAEDVRKVRADSTLILVSSHSNGSLNTWSVELTVQSNYCTSIAGLIHCAGTGGHRSEVTQIHRHPWLPVLMTISSCGSGDSGGVGKEGMRERVSELIIWNADLPGPLEHKSKLNELSRITSPDPSSFNHVIWVPPISMGTRNEGALARCPSLGLLIANVGKELVLFQASLYSITKPQPCSFMQSDKEKGKLDRKKSDMVITSPSSFSLSSSEVLRGIKVTSQLGMKGVELISIIEQDLSTFQEVVGLHVFRMCSLVTTFDLKASLDSKLSKDVVLVLLENKKPESNLHLSRSGSSSALGTGSKGTRSYLHMWRLTICSDRATPSSLPHSASHPDFLKDFVGTANTNASSPKQEVVHTCIVHKVFSEPFLLPLPSGSFVVESSPACDVASSLQLQTPTLSAPYLFSTACSDGTVRCWQFSLRKNAAHSSPAQTSTERKIPEGKGLAGNGISFDVYEVFDSGSKTSEFSKLTPSVIDCYDEEVIRSLPTESFVPIGLKVAYPGRMAMAHLLSKPVKQQQHQRHRAEPSNTSRPFLISKDTNPLDRHSMVTLWECESSGGLRWSCEAMLMLVGVAQVAAGKEVRAGMSVLMEWVPMENGAYLLATCFASTISIFGMALHQETEQLGLVSKKGGLLPPREHTLPTLTRVEAQASWVCLLQFPCFQPSLDLDVSCLAYTGSNSLVLSIGAEIHLYSCWVERDKLVPVTYSPRVRWQQSGGKLADSKGRSYGGGVFPGGGTNPLHSDIVGHLEDSSVVNLLDYAHTWNTPLPQYHPRVLLELMNSGRLGVVKSVLVNLLRFLLLYQTKKGAGDEEGGGDLNWSYFNEEEIREDDGRRKRKKHLSLSSDGYLEVSRHSRPSKWVDTVPHLPLAKMGIISGSLKEDVAAAMGHLESLQAGGGRGVAEVDDYDELFSVGTLTNSDSPAKFGFEDEEEEEEEEICFTDLDPDKTEFTPKLADLLASMLEGYHLAGLTDLDHIQLLSIAQTVASTNTGLVEHSTISSGHGDPSSRSAAGLSFSSLSGAGYASSVMASKGREAMDDCGLRYLLALECSISLTKCLPEGVSPTPLPPSSLVWAFHSDAETELLSTLPCVREDDLKWDELRKAGVGWWLRSLDTLRRLVEKLAKAMFMSKQNPLDACLFYLAMKKQSLIKGLFKSVSDSRMATFFSNDFTSDRWKKAAQKNAFALLAKQRFEEAAAFFLLANRLWDAVEVCVSRLNDLQLAFVLVRLYEGDHGTIYQRFLKEHILGMPSQLCHGYLAKKEGEKGKTRGSSLEASPDPFLRSMAHWLLQDFSGSLETFLINPQEANNAHGGSRDGGLQVFLTHPAIFNFYFFLRMHPVLLRRDHKTSFLTTSTPATSGSSKSYGKGSHHLSSVGDEPLTAVERSLLFSTAYYHLCHGCPLLALNVFSRIPKSGDLGADICEQEVGGTGKDKQPQAQFGTKLPGGEGGGGGSVMSGMIDECAALGQNLSRARMAKERRGAPAVILEDDIDWGAPISGETCERFVADLKEEPDELDWSQPFISSSRSAGGMVEEEEEEEVDWSKPISSTRMDLSLDTPGLSPTSMDANSYKEEGGEKGLVPRRASLFTPRGLFVLTLACQLQYNACLSILTEELHSVYIPACCRFLWNIKGGRGGREEAILPLVKQKDKSEFKLVQHYSENAFDRILQNLRGTLMDWLTEEACAVKWLCHLGVDQEVKHQLEDSVNIETADVSAEHASDVVVTSAPSGYDLLTTLMNYSALHAATSPSLLTVKFELMHLVNTTLPWGTGHTHYHTSSALTVSPQGKDASSLFTRTPEAPASLPDIVPTLVFSPSQLPILTSCSLPVHHLTNLATHLRLLSGCVVKALSDHIFPPISTQPLPQVRRIFDLCCAISHCLTVSLNPVQLSEFGASAVPARVRACTSPIPTTGKNILTGSLSSLRRTPTPASVFTEQQQFQETKTMPTQTRTLPSQFKTTPPSQAPFLRRRLDSFNNSDLSLSSPNTKPSKWPGVNSWPCTLTSDEGRDPTPMSVVMVECIVSVYVGLLATAWSQHSIEDLLALLRNAPSSETWYSMVGGGIDGKKTERVSKNLFLQTIESVSKKLHLPKKNSPSPQEDDMTSGVFVAPRRTLLDLFLSPPDLEERTRMLLDETKGESLEFIVVKNDEEEEEGTENYETADDTFSADGITFQVGEGGEGGAETSPTNPNCFAWCLMNLCIAKHIQQVVRRMVACVGLEVLELITVSPLIYSTLKVLDEWESIFSRRLVALGEPPDDLFGNDDVENSKFKIGLALMRQKFILEPENSPFRGRDQASRSAKKLWKFFVHQDGPREVILQCVFVRKSDSVSQFGGGVEEDSDSEPSLEPTCRVIHKETDCTVSAICLNSCCRAQTSVMALALPREVMEIEVPDNSNLDNSGVDSATGIGLKTSSSSSLKKTGHRRSDDFIVVQSTSQLHRPKTTSMFSPMPIRRSLPVLPVSFGSNSQLTHGQTGNVTSLLMKRQTAGVKRMAPHPSLAYYLTGSLDGSVTMWEFGTPRPVACQRLPGMGGGVTKIRFTPEGNKFGVTDSSGRLSLWQGIHTSARSAYHILHSHMKYLSDFLFLGSSSLIATCGDGIESRNLYIWDTLMPTNRSIVREFPCHEGGATALGYSRTKQRLFCGGKKGEVCIFDIRQSSLLQTISLHSSSINCIVVNDIDGYFVTGAVDGDIKIVDGSTLTELAYLPGQHAKSRLFRHGEGGVTDLDILPGGKLYSCGADGSVKCQTLRF